MTPHEVTSNNKATFNALRYSFWERHPPPWPGSYIDITLPECLSPRRHTSCWTKLWTLWYSWHLAQTFVKTIAGKNNLVNDICDPKQLKRNDHFCQVLPTTIPTREIYDREFTTIKNQPQLLNEGYFSDLVKVNPDLILDFITWQRFYTLLQENDSLLHPSTAAAMVLLGSLTQQST